MVNIEKLSFPNEPGVYLMKDKKDIVIYIGKAKFLSKRIKSHFKQKEDFIKKEYLVPFVNSIEYIVTRDEVESLILEANLIKKHHPRFNIRLRDDKSYPYIKITLNEDYPRIIITRKKLNDKAMYFGPYTYAKGMKRTLQIIKELFPLRQCRKKLNKEFQKKPCLNYDIKFCLAPCVGLINKDSYYQVALQACKFLKGEKAELLEELKIQMNALSKELNFEAAARVRDKIKVIEGVIKHQETVSTQENLDVVALAYNQTLACVVVLLVRDRRICDQKHFFLDNLKYIKTDDSNLLSTFIKQYYLEEVFIPDEIILPFKIEDQEIIKAYLKEKSKKNIRLTVSKIGKKQELMKLALLNATTILTQKETTSVLGQLRECLKFNRLPRYIEGFDISNIGSKASVGSCVVFREGKPSKKEYRKFKIKTVKGQNDFAMLGEVVARRYERLLKENKNLPDLILVDGGAGQLNYVKSVLESIGIEDMQVVAIAKERVKLGKQERIFIPYENKAIILPKSSLALRLIQSIRNEAHRFAINYHKKLRSKEMVT
ncbi:MAG: excinuclease ABC subunit UvrC [bacterium]|nr:excinuclease ABC subunit UvrC [bacterium]